MPLLKDRKDSKGVNAFRRSEAPSEMYSKNPGKNIMGVASTSRLYVTAERLVRSIPS